MIYSYGASIGKGGNHGLVGPSVHGAAEAGTGALAVLLHVGLEASS